MNRQVPAEIEKKLITNLRRKGYKLTSQRLEIVKLLSQDRSHPGAMEILREVKKRLPRISMSTVYYTLYMLKREGLIQELEFYDTDNRYEVNVSDHINLVCKKCGKIEDFSDPLPVSFRKIEDKTGFCATEMRFEFYGLCKNCSGKR